MGFAAAGIASPDALKRRSQELTRWQSSGFAGGMRYMDSFLERQQVALDRFRNLKSIIVVAASYSIGRGGVLGRAEAEANDPPMGNSPLERVPSGRVARYARGRDYHRVILKALGRLGDFIRRRSAGPAELLPSVDKGPFPERVLAEAAGLGFLGKNTCLIRPKGGSFFFLGLLLTDLELKADQPILRDCGSCTLCLDACPTRALVRPYELDARRCIAYLTIESRDPIPSDLRPLLGDWIFGCDICQEVCPYNKHAVRPEPVEGRTPWPEFSTQAGAGGFLPLQETLAIRSEKAFQARFAGTALMRARREGLLRNACVAAANLQETGVIPALLETLREDSSPLVREHASWALGRFKQRGHEHVRVPRSA